MIVDDLCRVYGTSDFSDGVHSWHIECQRATVSLVHGRYYYSDKDSVEVAYLVNGKIAKPESLTGDPSVLSLFYGDVIAGFCKYSDVELIVLAAGGRIKQ
jgi:hypothetical protein